MNETRDNADSSETPTVTNPMLSVGRTTISSDLRSFNIENEETHTKTTSQSSAKSSSNLDDSSPVHTYSLSQSLYPAYLMAVAIFIAWIYTMIPNTNFWVYTCLKQQIWVVFAIVVYTEDLDAALPDTPDSVYISSYLVGIFLPLLISIVAYLAGVYESAHFYVQIFGTTSGVAGSIICYGVHAFRYPAPVSSTEHAALQRCLLLLTTTAKLPILSSEEDRTSGPIEEEDQKDIETNNIIPASPSKSTSLSLDGANARQSPSTTTSRPSFFSNYFDLFAASCSSREMRYPSDFLSVSAVASPNPLVSGDRHTTAGVPRRPHRSTTQTSTVLVAPPQQSWPPTTIARDFSPSRIRWLFVAQRLSFFFSPPVVAVVTTDHSTTDRHAVAVWSTRLYRTLVQACTLPRYFLRRRRLFTGLVLVDRRQQWLLASAFVAIINVYFYFLIFFTNFFRTHAGDDLIKLFLIYVLGTTLLRGILKRLGMALDKGKFGTTSLFFVAEFQALTFYYTFYRILFESIDSWGVFLLFQLLHLGSEWVLYPCRCSPWMVRLQQQVSDRVCAGVFCCLSAGATLLSTLSSPSSMPPPSSKVETPSTLRVTSSRVSLFVPRDTDTQDWLAFVGLDFGIRVVVMVTCAVGMLLLVLTVDECFWIDNALHQNVRDRRQSSIYILISVLLELTNAYVMNRMFFVPLQVDVYEKVRRVFHDRRFATISSTTAACLLLIPMYAFTTHNEYQSPRWSI